MSRRLRVANRTKNLLGVGVGEAEAARRRSCEYSWNGRAAAHRSVSPSNPTVSFVLLFVLPGAHTVLTAQVLKSKESSIA